MDKNIIKELGELGNSLVSCPLNCPGVDNIKKDGKIPRCINLEIESKNPNGKGVIIVGMNPGKANKKETLAYIKAFNENKPLFFVHQHYFKESNKDWEYHNKIRKILELLDFDGPILWSEVVKCQSEEGKHSLDVQTIRNCVHRFLKKEINFFPKWSILAIGKDSFRTCSLLFPERRIIGIEHPSGSNRTYHNFEKKLIKNLKKVKERLDDLREDQAIHIKDLLKELGEEE